MKTQELEYFKKKLEAEKIQLVEDLSGIARRDPSAVGGWEARTGEIKEESPHETEVADKLEELEGNSGITTQLENQLNEVQAAIERIENGNYGICETCGQPIEKERLEANPSARISIKHAHTA